MVLSIARRKWASALLVLALPLAATGCQSTGGGWGWSPSSTPSFSSLNPWKSSSSSLASSKPSNQVPTPPASMLSGGLAKNSQGAAPAYNANTYAGSRPTGGYTASTNDYGTRQVSATQGEGYTTGPYATGGATAQNGPYNPTGAASTYGQAATADRRSDAAFGAGTTSAGANTAYGAGNTAYGAANHAAGAHAAVPSYGSYPTAAAGPTGYAASPYTGTTGQSSGASAARGYAQGSSPTTYTGTDGYRPGSTGRTSAEIQKAGFANQDSAPADSSAVDYGSSYPTTGAGDESTYR